MLLHPKPERYGTITQRVYSFSFHAWWMRNWSLRMELNHLIFFTKEVCYHYHYRGVILNRQIGSLTGIRTRLSALRGQCPLSRARRRGHKLNCKNSGGLHSHLSPWIITTHSLRLTRLRDSLLCLAGRPFLNWWAP